MARGLKRTISLLISGSQVRALLRPPLFKHLAAPSSPAQNQKVGYSGRVAIAVYRHSEVEHLESAGADIVLEPFEDAAERTIKRVLEDFEEGRDRRPAEALP